MAEMKKGFTVSVVTREDLKNLGYHTDEVTDEVMQSIADYMDEEYRERGDYFLDLEIACKNHGVRHIQ